MGNKTPPLVPPECDLRDFVFMPLDVRRLRDSSLAAMASADEFRAAVLLWCASWHQQPAASLPQDDMVLANLAGYGHDVRAWAQVKKGALRCFIECSDGRLYHPVISQKANEAWSEKQAFAARKQAWTESGQRGAKRRWDGDPNRVPNRDPNRVPKPTLYTERDRERERDIYLSPPVGGDCHQSAAGDPCPHQKIIDLYHEILPMCPQVRIWDERRRSYLRARWREDPERQDLRWWEGYFRYVAKSRFLTGGGEARNGLPVFIANLEWLVRPKSLANVYEAKYHDG